jgi:hypothetical protein
MMAPRGFRTAYASLLLLPCECATLLKPEAIAVILSDMIDILFQGMTSLINNSYHPCCRVTSANDCLGTWPQAFTMALPALKEGSSLDGGHH